MNKTPGQIAFEAYNESKGGLTWDNRPIPPWSDVGDEVRKGWEAAAFAVMKAGVSTSGTEIDAWNQWYEAMEQWHKAMDHWQEAAKAPGT